MKARLVRIGNSRGVRIPQDLLRLYELREGAELQLEEHRDGILLRPVGGSAGKLPWAAAYREMAAEAAEASEWAEWDAAAGDALER